MKKAKRIEELIKKENVRILDAVSDWKEAIKVSLTPLVEQGYCKESYIDGVMENTYKFGPYYVLCEELALIHAEADKGVLATQLTITLLRKPIKFKEDGFNVRVLIGLSALDSQSHLYAMQAISNIFADTDCVNTIVNATSAEEIYQIFIHSVDS